jgi:hypothetical protein
MFRIIIDVSDLEQKIKDLDGPAFAKEVAGDIADEAVIPEMAKYPSPSGKKQPFRSAQSRKFFFAALKKGQINVPYRRTGRTGLTTKQSTANGVDVVSQASYSDKVRTKGKQYKYHEGTWEDTESIARRIEGGDADAIATAAVIKQLSKAGLT